ncbi:MAG: ParB/RepB/Spo0J family partition protein, partial [candidate division Zixibacteria bacterium]|nr:ParB/RepB/Spo0J family partition protein [candidate division Zixibacteria bacterium]
KDGGDYLLEVGERRLRAARLLNWQTIEAVVIEEQDSLRIASRRLVENLEREELTSVEKADGLLELKAKMKAKNWRAVDEETGLRPRRRQQLLAVKKLPEEIQGAIIKSEIADRHAQALLRLKTPAHQLKVFQRIKEENLNSDEVRHLVSDILKKPKQKSPELKRLVITYNSLNELIDKVESTLKELKKQRSQAKPLSKAELAAIKDYDDYTYAHSTNVCIYSLTLGVRLKMDRARLSQLGFAALFHDVGKVKLPSDLIKKPEAYDENDWLQMQQHPLLGAKTILRNMKLDLHTARGARGAFEHHINQDFTGYPQLKYKKRATNLFSKIIAIADSFDALTSGRIYVKKPIPPDEVLKKMHYQMAVKYDPFLLKIFTNIVGIYPAGSLVLLSTEELALILTNNKDNPAKPCVKLLGDKEKLFEEPVWADLSLPEHAERNIVRMVDPARYGLQVKDFILGD